MSERAPITGKLALFISNLRAADIPPEVFEYTKLLVFDGIGCLAAATHPAVSSSARIGAFAEGQGGPEQATLIGRGSTSPEALAGTSNT